MVTELPNTKLSQILSNIKSRDETTNLMEHLNKMYSTKKLMNDDVKYNDLFEDISIRIKKKGEYMTDEDKPKDINYIIDENEKKMFNPLTKAEGGENAEPQPVTSINFVPDYVEIFNKLSYGGLSFSPKEALFINN